MIRFEKWVYLLYNSKKFASKNSKIPFEIESEIGMTQVVDCVKNRMEIKRCVLVWKKLKKIIKNMLSKGKSRAEILNLTGISEEEYEKLVNNILELYSFFY